MLPFIAIRKKIVAVWVILFHNNTLIRTYKWIILWSSLDVFLLKVTAVSIFLWAYSSILSHNIVKRFTNNKLLVQKKEQYQINMFVDCHKWSIKVLGGFLGSTNVSPIANEWAEVWGCSSQPAIQCCTILLLISNTELSSSAQDEQWPEATHSINQTPKMIHLKNICSLISSSVQWTLMWSFHMSEHSNPPPYNSPPGSLWQAKHILVNMPN